MSEYLCKPETCDGTGDDVRCPHCTAFNASVTPTDRVASDRVREARERVQAYLDAVRKDTGHGDTRDILDLPHGEIYVLDHADLRTLLAAECGADTARVREALEYIADADPDKWGDHCRAALCAEASRE